MTPWTGDFGKCHVTATVVPGRYNGEGNLITIPFGDGRATTGGNGGTLGQWPANSSCDVVAHEAGHLMDLGDKYYKGKPWPDWTGNIMAEPGGRVEEKGSADLIANARRT